MMSLPRFIVRNILRNKRRTGLTVISIGFSLFLYIALTTFIEDLRNPPVTEDSVLRLCVRRAVALTEQLPLSYLEKLKQAPHVALVMPVQFFNGIYKEPKNFFANLAVDPVSVWQMFAGARVGEEAKRRFAAERTAAVAGKALADRFGWKEGDRITLSGTIVPIDLEFTLVGVYDIEPEATNFYFRYDYMNEALGCPNTVGAFWLKADCEESVPGIIDAVDAMFRNTAAETKTETEQAFKLGFVSMVGNIRLMIASVAVADILTMMLVAGSTMAMTVRERLREVAILKAIGYTRPLLFFLLLGEAVMIALLGYGVGASLVVALHCSDLRALTHGYVSGFSPPLIVCAKALVTGVGIGLVSGFLPALEASAITVTEGMRRLE
ncbi:MAG: ABC transporter permease [Candidatus Sumerlaeota bacterium]|nr:ABC transporter permease [Candidatus Sumerlaeota bacterium]